MRAQPCVSPSAIALLWTTLQNIRYASMCESVSCAASLLGLLVLQVQWNACYAVGSLLQTPEAAGLAASSGGLHQILASLLDLIRSSPSYKVRSHPLWVSANRYPPSLMQCQSDLMCLRFSFDGASALNVNQIFQVSAVAISMGVLLRSVRGPNNKLTVCPEAELHAYCLACTIMYMHM